MHHKFSSTQSILTLHHLVLYDPILPILDLLPHFPTHI